MWLALVIITGLLFTAEELTKRFVLRAQVDTWAFSFYYSLIGTVITLPALFLSPYIPSGPTAWLMTILIGALIVANNWLFFTASGMLEASLVGSVMKLRLVWIFLLGLLVLGEPFSAIKLLGTIFTIAAGLVIIGGFKRPKSAQGVGLVVAATFFNAGIIIIAKEMLGSASAIGLTFFAFFVTPLFLNILVIPNLSARLKKLRPRMKGVVLACALGALANLTLIGALSLNYATDTVVITEAFLILILVGEHIFLKEREYLWVKAVSVALAITGAILIQS